MVGTPAPQCTALAAAKEKKGLSYEEIAAKIGKDKDHVINVCTGKVKPTEDEFNALAVALDVQQVPHTGAHATK
ncbi:hypothetical protein BDV98DRAFT_603428 [Pterulicium gracile]|uniref:HTH cro/C1-type domain-containing protein n=1 Tax=Pterulicium gracile TaxID=1884261 RepID=A0A5C3QXL5_9AGAR|nr:hypothetical protein BDV98DRAFT_603428 [Pterula gracilis]